jgi:hypothetical protein
MAARPSLSIQAAVIDGFARCTESTAPLCCLGDFLEELRGLGWERKDVQAVEMFVLDFLRQSKEQALEQPRSSDAA